MPQDFARDLLEAEEAFLRVGNVVTRLDGAELISNPHLHALPEANQVRRIRARDDDAGDRLVGEAERHFRSIRPAVRRWVLDPGATPARFGEFLEQQGYAGYPEEGLVARDAAAAPLDPDVRLREIRDDADWDLLEKLDISSNERRLTLEMWDLLVELRRLKAKDPAFRYRIVELREEPIGVVGLYRTPSVGLIEDLYIRPELRDKGIGRGVLARLAAELGRDSALGVVCPADESESEFYTHLGFEAVFKLRTYEKA